MALYGDALAIQRELGDRAGSARTLGNLAWVALHEGDLERAGPLCEESVALFRELKDEVGTAIALNRLGSLARQRGDLVAARAAYEESLALRRAAGDPRGVAVVTDNLARVALAEGAYERTATLLGAAGRVRTEIAAPVRPVDREEHARLASAVRDALGTAAHTAAWARGRR